MVKKTWNFTLEDGGHTVAVQQGFLSNDRKILLDGQPHREVIFEANWLGEGEYEFPIGKHTGKVAIKTNFLNYSYDLAVDGVSVTTGKPLVPSVPMPWWGWVFMAACLLIPILAVGGAFPMLFGIGGAALCAAVVRDSTRSTPVRLALCAGITGLAWVLFFLLVFGVALING